MKILLITSEIDGIVKTGGLADFAAALPKALMERGHDVRVILPKYKNAIFPPSDTALNGTALNGTALNGTALNSTALNSTPLNGTAKHVSHSKKKGKKGKNKKNVARPLPVKSNLISLSPNQNPIHFSPNQNSLSFHPNQNALYFNLNHSDSYGCLVHCVLVNTIPVWLVEHHHFFSREGIYGDGITPYPDNALRYAFLCKASIEQCLSQNWIPDIIHCNDWQTALAPYYLKEHYLHHQKLKNTKTVLTIHNGEYQGKTDIKWLDSLGIMPQRFTSELMEEYGMLNLLKCGIMYADSINAVSYGYSEELLHPETSHNLWHYLNKRRKNFKGILNGCDYTLWNPKSSPFLPHHFSIKNMAGKALCKSALQTRMGLPQTNPQLPKTNIQLPKTNTQLTQTKDIPLLGLIGRLTAQKGFDYLIPALEQLLYEDTQVQFVLLGSGDPDYGSRLHHLQQRYSNKMSFINDYDNWVSHLIEAGSDFFMMPSLFEPCGLNQLYSLAYGTIPIIRSTGGLKDTVVPLELNNGNAAQATGISFSHADTYSCYHAIKRAISLYVDYQPIYLQMQQRAMMQLFTWQESAKQYEMLYQQTILNVTDGTLLSLSKKQLL